MNHKRRHSNDSARIALETVERQLKKEKLAKKRATRIPEIKARIDLLPKKTLAQIQRSLRDPAHNKKDVAREFDLPHNIIMYIWRHYS